MFFTARCFIGSFPGISNIHTFCSPDVLPVHQASHQYVSEQRQQQYDDLHEALEAMRKIDETTPLPEVHLKMFLIESGLLPFNQSGMVR